MRGLMGFVRRRWRVLQRGDMVRRRLMLARPKDAHAGDLARKVSRH